MEIFFAKGQTVRLKSGGPIMTVAKTGGHGPLSIHCIWFERNKLLSESFDPATLDHIRMPDGDD
jgi:uncharacterized protein YodC (DUF2158 family)